MGACPVPRDSSNQVPLPSKGKLKALVPLYCPTQEPAGPPSGREGKPKLPPCLALEEERGAAGREGDLRFPGPGKWGGFGDGGLGTRDAHPFSLGGKDLRGHRPGPREQFCPPPVRPRNRSGNPFSEFREFRPSRFSATSAGPDFPTGPPGPRRPGSSFPRPRRSPVASRAPQGPGVLWLSLRPLSALPTFSTGTKPVALHNSHFGRALALHVFLERKRAFRPLPWPRLQWRPGPRFGVPSLPRALGGFCQRLPWCTAGGGFRPSRPSLGLPPPQAGPMDAPPGLVRGRFPPSVHVHGEDPPAPAWGSRKRQAGKTAARWRGRAGPRLLAIHQSVPPRGLSPSRAFSQGFSVSSGPNLPPSSGSSTSVEPAPKGPQPPGAAPKVPGEKNSSIPAFPLGCPQPQPRLPLAGPLGDPAPVGR